jgi:hypothetical protein
VVNAIGQLQLQQQRGSLTRTLAVLTIASALILAAFGRGALGLKPGELALVGLLCMLAIRRIWQHDYSFNVTAIDGAFCFIILGGTVLPLLAIDIRSSLVTTATLRALLSPIEYYLWYRALLEALGSSREIINVVRIIIPILACIGLLGILQVLRVPGIEPFLLHAFPTYATTESQVIRRATSVVGNWETLGVLMAYAIIIANQAVLGMADLYGKRTRLWLTLAASIAAVALLATVSLGGFIALIMGLAFSWRCNRRISQPIIIALIVMALSTTIMLPILRERATYQFTMVPAAHVTIGPVTIPQTWQTRMEHWQIVASTVFSDPAMVVMGVRPDFAYPVLAFNSTESLYLLLLYRGGIIYLALFVLAVAVAGRALWQRWQATSGIEWHLITIVSVIFATNLLIDFIDAHLFEAGEAQLLFTLLAIGSLVPVPRLFIQRISASNRKRHPLAIASTLIRLALIGILVMICALGGVAYAHNRHLSAPSASLQVLTLLGPSAITYENSRSGTADWQIPVGTDTTFIQGYASTPDALPGDRISLYISARQSITAMLDVYRIGWYYGLGGHRYLHQASIAIPAQGYWDAKLQDMRDCNSCNAVDGATGWSETISMTIGRDWPSGVYLIKISSLRRATYIPLIVRSRSSSSMLAVIPISSYQTENIWGGADWGTSNTDQTSTLSTNQTVLLRPYISHAGGGTLIGADLHSIRFLERAGYDLSYTTDIAEANPATQTTASKAAILLRSPSSTLSDAVQHIAPTSFLIARDASWPYRLDEQRFADETAISIQGDQQAVDSTISALNALLGPFPNK